MDVQLQRQNGYGVAKVPGNASRAMSQLNTEANGLAQYQTVMIFCGAKPHFALTVVDLDKQGMQYRHVELAPANPVNTVKQVAIYIYIYKYKMTRFIKLNFLAIYIYEKSFLSCIYIALDQGRPLGHDYQGRQGENCLCYSEHGDWRGYPAPGSKWRAGWSCCLPFNLC